MSLSETDIRRIQYRKWYLPRAIDAAERKLEALYKEAAETGRKDLLPEDVNRAWDRTVEIAKRENGLAEVAGGVQDAA